MSAPEAHTYKRPESVLVVVYTRTGKVLMMRRADHAEFWQSVTGSLEWGVEDKLATARRELREETGIDAAQLRDWSRHNVYTIFQEWRHLYAPGISENTEHVFSLELSAEVPITLNPAEHVDYAWLDFAEAARLATSWSNRDAILQIAAERDRVHAG